MNPFARRRSIRSLERQIDELSAENRRLLNELDAIQARFSSLARGTWQVQENERRKLARELHDHLGQLLTALVHRLERLSGAGSEDCLELARQALADTRELSRLIRPPILDDLGLGPALEWLARRARESSGIEVTARLCELPGRPDAEVETLLFRVAQESLNNALRHGQASHIELRLDRLGNRLELRVRDDGIGFDPQQRNSEGFGLAGMKERVNLFGGELAIVSAPGRGTAITATVFAESGHEPATLGS